MREERKNPANLSNYKVNETEKSPANPSSTWVPTCFRQTLCQWRDHFLSWWHINCHPCGNEKSYCVCSLQYQNIRTAFVKVFKHTDTQAHTHTHTHSHAHTHSHTHTHTHTFTHAHTHTHTHIHTHIHTHAHIHTLCMTNKLTQIRELLRKKLNEDS